MSKYGKQGYNCKISVFWKNVFKLKNIVETGLIKTVGNGGNVLFWTDRWLHDCAQYM